MVAAPHYLAAQAGLDMIKAGGNAIDAAIAANAVLQVVYPQLLGLGGDLFILLHSGKDGQLHALNASGRSPAAATIERYHAFGHTTMPGYGLLSVTVPGCADGWEMAATRFGRLGLARALGPAIAYAEGGFPVSVGVHNALTRMSALAHTHRSWRDNFTPGGRIPPAGSVARAPQLGATLRAIAEQGAAAFYTGAVAERIAAFFAAEGGLITLEDLAAHHGDWVTPLAVPFGDLMVYEMPPNTQGVTALQMLGIAAAHPAGADPLDADTVHIAVEAQKLAFAERAAYVTDLDHMHVSPAALLAPDYLRERAALIDPRRAMTSPVPSGLNGDTVYLCAADEEGNAVSLIQSNFRGFGSGYVVDGTGIALQNRGAYFSLDQAAANALAPNKRTLHTLIPSLALRDGKPEVIFGTMGGDGQPQTHLQVYTALERFGMNIQAALELPRWVHETDGHATVERLWLESRFPEATLAELAARGHQVSAIGPWDSQTGHAQGIVIDHVAGVLHGGADPRAEGAAVGW
ncbi:MAG TPA: gamma-glutamyltransferase [Ktedonobacterales bacterium]|nr:gamma-glutamyltransferase [Ktedonobacterales bacterium]